MVVGRELRGGARNRAVEVEADVEILPEGDAVALEKLLVYLVADALCDWRLLLLLI